MNDEKQKNGFMNWKNKHPSLWTSMGVIASVLLIFFITHLGNKLKTIEDELSHCAPDSTFGIDISKSQIVYAPVYTFIETGVGEMQQLDAVLGIRNSDPEHSITITSARFYDGKGNMVREYFDGGPVQLAPLEARTLTMRKSELRDVGSAANFIVAWHAEVPVYEPIIDAIMFGFIDGRSITFKSVGRPLTQRIE